MKKGASTKSEPAKESKPKEKQWTPQDEAARKIQTQIRKFLAKRKLEKKKQQKKDYEELMDKLEQEVSLESTKVTLRSYITCLYIYLTSFSIK